MKKILIGLAVSLLIVLLVGLLVLGFSLNGIVKRGVETYGPKFTKVSVQLSQVKLSPFSGSGEINGLVVGNPEGFSAPHAISVGTARLVVAPASLMSDKVVVKEVKIDAPEITLETGLNGTNLKKILANVNEAAGGGGSADQTKSGGPGKKLEVDEFVISNAKLNFTVTGLGSQNVTLPEIRFTDLGKGPEGITSAELTKTVLTAVEAAAAKAVAENSGDIAKGAASLVKGLTGKTNTAAVENLGKGIGDLLKKK